jgi:hypothetical protein
MIDHPNHSVMSWLSQLRQPEYTGENRCIPCTIANVAIAAIGSALLARRSKWLGAGTFTAALGTIHLRGYLVPGTPALTKRYLPDRILRWFEHDAPTLTTAETETTDSTDRIDPEHVLLAANVVQPCENDSDLCLTPVFETRWREQVPTTRERELDATDLRAILDGHSDRFSIDEYGEALVARTDDTVIGQWPSQAALVADIAAAAVLNQRYTPWATLSSAARAQVLMSLRVFIDTCPACDGSVRIAQEVVESCCRSYDEVRAACQDCEAQLFEIEWDAPEPTAPDDDSPTAAPADD